MSHEISVSAGKSFGLQRVCQVLEFPRSTIYAVRARASANVTPIVPRKRGPKPKMPDADLLHAIRADLAASPFKGEGHRKVWARLRILTTFGSPGPACCG
jgi:putative transposase